MKRIIIASDSFKGSLSSAEIAGVLGQAFSAIDPDCEVHGIEVADGGEGTVEAIMAAKGGEWVFCEVQDPLGRPVRAGYAMCGDTAVVQTSAASGLPLLAEGERNPMLASSYGTGQLILDALRKGCRKVILGLGGSATNDAGIGLMSALGVKFLDDVGEELRPDGDGLCRVCALDLRGLAMEAIKADFELICDVDSPFCGPEGAAFTFGAQKGATPRMAETLDKGMERFAALLHRTFGVDVTSLPGAGAAGGIGGAARAFLGGSLRPGIEVVLDTIGFDAMIAGADLVITGEGRMDWQTATGKTPAGVLWRARKQGIPTIAIAGKVLACPELDALGFTRIFQTAEEGVPLDTAMSAAYMLRRLTGIAGEIMEMQIPR